MSQIVRSTQQHILVTGSVLKTALGIEDPEAIDDIAIITQTVGGECTIEISLRKAHYLG